MKHGMVKGLMTGMLIGGAAATMFGVMNWQTERRWNQQMRKGGQWLSEKADSLKEAIDKAYAAVEKIHFDNAYYRHDIGARAMKAAAEV